MTEQRRLDAAQEDARRKIEARHKAEMDSKRDPQKPSTAAA